MADQLSVTITFVEDHYEVTAFMADTLILPEAIFLYENTGTTGLGDYYGVAGADELEVRQVWTGVIIPTFGNKFVRYAQALIVVPTQEEAEISKAWIQSNVARLKQQILAKESNTQVTTI